MSIPSTQKFPALISLYKSPDNEDFVIVSPFTSLHLQLYDPLFSVRMVWVLGQQCLGNFLRLAYE